MRPLLSSRKIDWFYSSPLTSYLTEKAKKWEKTHTHMNIFHLVSNQNTNLCICIYTYMGFSGGSDDKETACSTGDLGLISGSGRSPGEEHGNPLQYSCLTEEPGGLQSIGSQRVRHDWSNLACTYMYICIHTYIYMCVCRVSQVALMIKKKKKKHPTTQCRRYKRHIF